MLSLVGGLLLIALITSSAYGLAIGTRLSVVTIQAMLLVSRWQSAV